jgi:hypothetical protein
MICSKNMRNFGFKTFSILKQICNTSNHIPRINDIEFTPYLSECSLIKRFGKYIGELFIGSHIGNHNISLDGVVSQKMVSDINVFDYRMLTWVVSNLYGTLIVT